MTPSARSTTPLQTTAHRFIMKVVSISKRHGHRHTPERQLLGTAAEPFLFVHAADGPKVSHVPVDADAVRNEPRHAPAQIHGGEIPEDNKHGKKIRAVDPHDAAATDR